MSEQSDSVKSDAGPTNPGPADHVSGTPYMPDPSGWRWLRFVLDHNPCFLLSALFMFLGVFLLNAARDVSAAEMGKLLGVLAAINVYEVALIGLALVLLKKTGNVQRDAFLLLFVQMLFLTDGGFLLNEAIQTSPKWGWLVNVLLFVLAVGKATVAMRGLGIPLRLRSLGFLVLQLAMMYGLPIVFSRVANNGEVSAGAMYAAWWVVGLMPVLYDLLVRTEAASTLAPRQELLRKCYAIIPWLLLIAHLGFFHYVYRAEFTLADLSPVLLGLAVATRRARATRIVPAGHLAFFRYALPAAAILFSLASPPGMAFVSLFGKALSPILVTAAAAFVTYAYFMSLRTAAWAIAGTVLMAIGHAMSPHITSGINHTFDAGDRVIRFFLGLLPTTTAGWGIAAMAAAFVLLGLGAMASLRRTASTSSWKAPGEA